MSIPNKQETTILMQESNILQAAIEPKRQKKVKVR